MDEREQISIALIALYAPAVLIAVFLAFRHGFQRSSAWRYVVIFSLIRIVGSSLQIMTVSDPGNIGLYTGAAVCQSVGLSPLILAALGLLGRIAGRVNPQSGGIVTSGNLRIVQVIVLVGLILGIKGGIDAGNQFSQSGKFVYGSLSQAAVALFIIAYVLIIMATLGLLQSTFRPEDEGEKRLLIAVAASLPFLLVRIIYSCLSTFTTNSEFSQISGNPTILLVMGFVMELIVIILYEAVGLTLRRIRSDQYNSEQPHYENVQADVELAPTPEDCSQDQRQKFLQPRQSQPYDNRTKGNSAAGIIGAMGNRRGILGRVIAAAASQIDREID
jgi:hypothetical protein